MTTAVRARARCRRGRGATAGGRVRHLRHHRRSGQGDDVPLALPPGAARPAGLPDRRRRRRRLDAGRPARARARLRSRRPGRSSTTAVFDRFAARLSRICGRLRRRRDVRARSPRRSRRRDTPVFYLEIPPFLFGAVVKGLADAGLTEDGARRRREAVRPRSRVGPRARRRDPPVPRRVAAVPDRPLPREDGPGGDPLPPVRQRRCSSRCGTATTSRASRSRWPRASASRTAGTSTTRSARCATSSSTT